MARAHCLVALALSAALMGVAASGASKPHIVFILVDDFGWADAGWHRPKGYSEVQTPNMDELVATGVELDQHYTSGRNPIHVNAQNLSPDYRNPANPDSGFSGVARNMTGMASKMRAGGYRTAAFGKWDAGMATEDHTPFGRGYDESVMYFEHQNEYWSSRWGRCVDAQRKVSVMPHDLWCHNSTDGGPCGRASGRPGTDIVNPDRCEPPSFDQPFPTGANATGCKYEDELFTEMAVSSIERHAAQAGGDPFFLFFSPHTIHSPYQVPQSYYDDPHFSGIEQHNRRTYHAMVKFADDAVGRVVAALKATGMYGNALIVLSADNGGPIYHLAPPASENGFAGAINYPLKGGKASNWQGGIRVNAFASGGFIPAAQRGTKREGLAALWDWYTTFSTLAGVDPTDHRAAAAGLPPVDGVDLWPYISGAAPSSPRTSLPLGSTAGHHDLWGNDHRIITNGIIIAEAATDAEASQRALAGSGEATMALPPSTTDGGGGKLWKLLLGDVPMSGWTGPQYPNASTTWVAQQVFGHCGTAGCLFELGSDPTEHADLAASMPQQVAAMKAALGKANATTFSPFRGKVDPAACTAALARQGVFWGPWIQD